MAPELQVIPIAGDLLPFIIAVDGEPLGLGGVRLAGAMAFSATLGGEMYISGRLALSGDLRGEGRVAGTLRVVDAVRLSGAVAGLGTLSGALTIGGSAAVSLFGTISGTCSLSGAFEQAMVLRGDALGAGALASAPTIGIALTGSATGGGVVAGAPVLTASFAGSAIGAGVLAGTLSQAIAFTGAAAGAGSLVGALRQAIALAGSAAGAGLLLGPLRQDVALSAGARGAGSLAGTMTVTSATNEDADAASYLNAQTTPPSSTERSLVDALVKGLKTDGIWAKLDRLSLLAAETAQAARLCLRNPAKSMAAINLTAGAFTANRGYTGDIAASGYLDFNEPFAFSGANFTLDSASIFYICNLGSTTVGLQGHIGVTGALRAGISARNNAGNNTFAIGDSTASAYTGTGVRTGFRCASRVESTTKRIYNADGLVTALAIASTSVSATNGCALRSTASYSDDRLAAAGSGGGLTATDVANLNTRLNTYLTAKGAA